MKPVLFWFTVPSSISSFNDEATPGLVDDDSDSLFSISSLADELEKELALDDIKPTTTPLPSVISTASSGKNSPKPLGNLQPPSNVSSDIKSPLLQQIFNSVQSNKTPPTAAVSSNTNVK